MYKLLYSIMYAYYCIILYIYVYIVLCVCISLYIYIFFSMYRLVSIYWAVCGFTGVVCLSAIILLSAIIKKEAFASCVCSSVFWLFPIMICSSAFFSFYSKRIIWPSLLVLIIDNPLHNVATYSFHHCVILCICDLCQSFADYLLQFFNRQRAERVKVCSYSWFIS